MSKKAKLANVLPFALDISCLFREQKLVFRTRRFVKRNRLRLDCGSVYKLLKISHKTIVSSECFFTGSDYYATRSNRIKDVYLCHCISTKIRIDAK